MKRILASCFLICLLSHGLVEAQQAPLSYWPAKPTPGDSIKLTYAPAAEDYPLPDSIECRLQKWGLYEDEIAIQKNLKFKSELCFLKKDNNGNFSTTIGTDFFTRGITYTISVRQLYRDRLKIGYRTKKIPEKDTDTFIPFYTNGHEAQHTNYLHARSLSSKGDTASLKNREEIRACLLKESTLYPESSYEIMSEVHDYYLPSEQSAQEALLKDQINKTMQSKNLNNNDLRLLNILFRKLGISNAGSYFERKADSLVQTSDDLKIYADWCSQFNETNNIRIKYELLLKIKTQFDKLSYDNKLTLAQKENLPQFKTQELIKYALLKNDSATYSWLCKSLNITEQTILLYPENMISEIRIIKDTLNRNNWAESKSLKLLSFFSEMYNEAINKQKFMQTYADEYISDTEKLHNIEYAIIWLNDILADINKDRYDHRKAFYYINSARNMLASINRNFDNQDKIYEKFCTISYQSLKRKDLKKEVEKVVSDGYYSQKAYDILKEIYVLDTKSAEGFDVYLNILKKSGSKDKKRAITSVSSNTPAPNFRLLDLDGKVVKLSDFLGQIVVLDFWAIWCEPCKASFPAMKKLQENYEREHHVKFLFIDTYERYQSIEENYRIASNYLHETSYPFHVLLDVKSAVAKSFKITGIPTKIVIDKTGNLRYSIVGFEINEEKMIEEMDMLIKSLE